MGSHSSTTNTGSVQTSSQRLILADREDDGTEELLLPLAVPLNPAAAAPPVETILWRGDGRLRARGGAILSTSYAGRGGGLRQAAAVPAWPAVLGLPRNE